ncbi:MAG: hypothetical protein J2P54_16715 [Bradyrhizobiaceae bacterium]|nr:hypothetical protein [Bradyrhizobiaceae bacterium]
MATVLVVAPALTLTACSSTLLSEAPASLGGLPAGTPERPSTQAVYPAVHDMPPPRDSTVLTDAEQKKIQNALNAARDQQNKRSAASSADNQ